MSALYFQKLNPLIIPISKWKWQYPLGGLHLRFLPFGLVSSQGNLEDASEGHSITKFFCWKEHVLRTEVELLYNLWNTYIVPSAFWYLFCTRNMKATLATRIVTAKCCAFKSTATASYPPASRQLRIKVDCGKVVEVYIRSPENIIKFLFFTQMSMESICNHIAYYSDFLPFSTVFVSMYDLRPTTKICRDRFTSVVVSHFSWCLSI